MSEGLFMTYIFIQVKIPPNNACSKYFVVFWQVTVYVNNVYSCVYVQMIISIFGDILNCITTIFPLN